VSPKINKSVNEYQFVKFEHDFSNKVVQNSKIYPRKNVFNKKCSYELKKNKYKFGQFFTSKLDFESTNWSLFLKKIFL
jgi:hypothetical protein